MDTYAIIGLLIYVPCILAMLLIAGFLVTGYVIPFFYMVWRELSN